jgi:hypothetical protein
VGVSFVSSVNLFFPLPLFFGGWVGFGAGFLNMMFSPSLVGTTRKRGL